MKEICVRASEDSLPEVSAFIAGELGVSDLPPQLWQQIRLAIEEVFVNIVAYAYEDMGEHAGGADSPLYGKVLVACEKRSAPSGAIIRFTDAGIPFNPLTVEEADTSGTLFMEREGGFGIHLVKNTMDLVEYTYRDGTNTLTLTKHFGP